jgi:hypothetical protein
MKLLIRIFRILIAILITKTMMIPFSAKDYLSNVVVKQEILKSIKTKKIIILGNSASAFGINGNIIQQRTGFRTIIMGIHGGLGLRGQYSDAIKEFNDSDLIIWNYSFENIKDPLAVKKQLNDFHDQNPTYSISYNPNIFRLIKSLFVFKLGKNDYTGVYSYDNFDSTGSIILKSNQDTSAKIVVPISKIPRLSSENITSFIKLYPKSIGKNSFFVHTPIGIISKKDSFNIDYNLKLCKKHKINYIISPLFNVYPKPKSYYDGFPHLSSTYRDTNTNRIVKFINF